MVQKVQSIKDLQIQAFTIAPIDSLRYESHVANEVIFLPEIIGFFLAVITNIIAYQAFFDKAGTFTHQSTGQEELAFFEFPFFE